MAGRLKGTPKTGGRKAGTPNKRTVALQRATAAAAEQIKAALGPDTFDGDAHALLMSVYRDPRQPIELRMDAAKAALPFEKPRLAAIETKSGDELDPRGMSDTALVEHTIGILIEGGLSRRVAIKFARRQLAPQPRIAGLRDGPVGRARHRPANPMGETGRYR